MQSWFHLRYTRLRRLPATHRTDGAISRRREISEYRRGRCGGDATCDNRGQWYPYTPDTPWEGGKSRALFHFSFTFASAERKITGSHYARHVGSFMSLSPGPSTFAIFPPDILRDPLSLTLIFARFLSLTRVFSRGLFFLRSLLRFLRRAAARREEDIIYFVN